MGIRLPASSPTEGVDALRQGNWSAYCVALAAFLSAFAATPARAHSFDVDIVFPESAPADARDSFLREFRRASAERDGHAGDESDGHLGGLDVYTSATALKDGDQSLTVGDVRNHIEALNAVRFNRQKANKELAQPDLEQSVHTQILFIG